jgi:hypothetical protein
MTVHAILTGKWTYRSFRNDPASVGDDAQKALDLFFAEGTIAIEIADGHVVKATLSWSDQVQMYLSGRLFNEQGAGPSTVVMTGIGIDDSPTQGWSTNTKATLCHPGQVASTKYQRWSAASPAPCVMVRERPATLRRSSW